MVQRHRQLPHNTISSPQVILFSNFVLVTLNILSPHSAPNQEKHFPKRKKAQGIKLFKLSFTYKLFFSF